MKTTIAFDVDGTLTHQSGTGEDTPRYEVIQLFRTLQAFGCEMYVWSGGGRDYAERWAEKLGLDAKICTKGAFTPDIAVDDFPEDDQWFKSPLGKTNIKV